jgi:hypothetical protein
MSSELQGAIDVLVKRVEQKAQELAENKRLVNSLCREAGLDPYYPDSDLAETGFAGLPSLQADQFYGKSPITAAREYLELRRTAVPLEEVLAALERGGFDFVTQGWKDEARLKNLGISLGKNSSIFHRLPNNTWGLTKNYNIKKKVAKESGKTEPAGEETNDKSAEESSGGEIKTANAE